MKLRTETRVTVGLDAKEGKWKEVKNTDGKVDTVSVFDDKNQNSVPDEKEILRVEQYIYGRDNSYTKRTYIDNDMDGYSDEVLIEEYDNNGSLVSKKKRTEGNINEERLEADKYNRNMMTHRNGIYMM